MAPKRELPVWKKALLSVLATLVFFVALELLLAAVGVRPQLYDQDPYVGFASHAPLFVEKRLADGSKVLTTAKNKLRLFNDQQFPAQKERGTYRIFCVGGSTTHGRPYGDVTSFCGWLREFLPVADPSRTWEVINAGGVSYASYRVALLMEELQRYQPDLFLIYTGHNEFLENRTYQQIIAVPRAVRGLGALASKTRTATLLEKALTAIRSDDEPTRPAGELLSDEVTTKLDDSIGPEAYTRDDAQQEKVLQHYRFNLARMMDIAAAGGAEAILITPASNLRNCSPFKSEHRPEFGPSERKRWNQLVLQADEIQASGDHNRALSAIREAQAIDDRHAHLAYSAGWLLDRLGRFEAAKSEYERARDEDICPLRALGPMPGIASAVAAEREVPVVDFEALVAAKSEQGIPGENLFLDHVHPTIAGNRMLALAVLETIAEQGWCTPRAEPDWGAEAIAGVVTRVESNLDTAAHGLALMRLSKVLGWAGKLGDAHRLARRAVEAVPEDAAANYQAGLCANMLGRMDEAVYFYQRTIAIEPTAALAHGNLGVALEKRGQISDATKHFRAALENGDDRAAPRNRSNLAGALAKLSVRPFLAGEYDQALALLSEADQLAPGNSDTLDQMGTVLLAQGQPEAAVERFRAALQFVEDDAGVHNRLAIALATLGRIEEAKQEYRRALRIDPSVAQQEENLIHFLRFQSQQSPGQDPGPSAPID